VILYFFEKILYEFKHRPFSFVVLVGASFLLFINTFENGWTYDDFPVIVQSPDVRSWAGFLNDSYPGRPFRELTYLVDYALFGYKPFGWHFQQIFWHALNGWLVFRLTKSLKLPSFVSWMSALLFLYHPLQVEVVANISHRKDSLALAGILGALLVYNKVFSVHGAKRIALLVVSAIFFVLACFAKQTAVVTPLILFSYEIAFVPQPERIIARSPKIIGAIVSFFFIIGLVWFFVFGGYQNYMAAMPNILITKANYLGEPSLPVYIPTLLKAWGFMILKIFYPVGLAPEYIFPVTAEVFDLNLLVGVVLIVMTGAASFFFWHRWSCGFFLLAASVFLFLPTSNIWPVAYLAADRYLYAPMVFISILFSVGICKILPKPELRYPTVLMILVCLSMLTWNQNSVWASPETLWEHAYTVNPDSAFVLNNMGNLALLDGNNEKAGDFYWRSIEINPTNPTAYYNLGMIAEKNWNLKQALSHYREFARINHPQFQQELKNLRSRLRKQYGIDL